MLREVSSMLNFGFPSFFLKKLKELFFTGATKRMAKMFYMADCHTFQWKSWMLAREHAEN